MSTLSTNSRPISHQYSPVLNEEPKKKGCGCFLIGCLGSTLIGILAIVGVTVYSKNVANQFILDYTEETPASFSEISASAEELEAASAKISMLDKAFDSSAGPQTIDLSARDLNVFFSSNHKANPLRSGDIKVRAEISDKFSTRFSVPLELATQLSGGLLAGEGRYFNGKATLRVFTDESGPKVYLDSLDLKAKALPSTILSKLSSENIIKKGSSNNKEFNDLLDKIESLEIVDGSLRITTK